MCGVCRSCRVTRGVTCDDTTTRWWCYTSGEPLRGASVASCEATTKWRRRGCVARVYEGGCARGVRRVVCATRRRGWCATRVAYEVACTTRVVYDEGGVRGCRVSGGCRVRRLCDDAPLPWRVARHDGTTTRGDTTTRGGVWRVVRGTTRRVVRHDTVTTRDTTTSVVRRGVCDEVRSVCATRRRTTRRAWCDTTTTRRGCDTTRVRHDEGATRHDDEVCDECGVWCDECGVTRRGETSVTSVCDETR